MALQREQIVAASLALLDRVGADGLTMRALAKELQVKAPTLYWHFSGKQALFDAMADTMVARVDWKPGPEAGWEGLLAAFADRLRAALLRYRDGGRVFAGTFSVAENTLRVGDKVVGALIAAGFSHREAAWSMFGLVYYVIGFVLEEQAIGDGGDAKASAIGKEIASHVSEHPNAAAAVLALLGERADDRFAFGRDAMIAGLRSRIAPAEG